jgi:SAM-dependent methyltransferase
MNGVEAGLAAYTDRWTRYRSLPLQTDISGAEDMLASRDEAAVRQYFEIGESALELITTALLIPRLTDPRRILELPCGFGRVTRHLVTFFPESEVWVSDLYPDRVAFCCATFGAVPLLSKERLSEIEAPEQFDVVFSGSLLTHLDDDLFVDALDFFRTVLSPRGVAIVTLHGRWSPHFQRRWKYMADDDFAVAEQAFLETGFGYSPYPGATSFDLQESYGVSLSAPHWVMRHLERWDDIRLYSYTERGWADHQDVLVFGRPGITA